VTKFFEDDENYVRRKFAVSLVNMTNFIKFNAFLDINCDQKLQMSEIFKFFFNIV